MKSLRTFLFGMALCCCSAVWSKVFLVTVGVGDYRKAGESILNLTVNDAQAVAALFQANADSIGSKADICVLTDSAATVANIQHAMDSLYSQAEAKDIIMLFFSGHGRNGLFHVYDDMLSEEVVVGAMKRSKSRKRFLFADACESGGLIDIVRTDKQDTIVKQQPRKKNSVMIFMSSTREESSHEHQSMSNGFFTTSLLEALEGKADTNGDSIVVAKELYLYVKKRMAQIAQEFSYEDRKVEQHPVMKGKFSINMPIIKWTKQQEQE